MPHPVRLIICSSFRSWIIKLVPFYFAPKWAKNVKKMALLHPLCVLACSEAHTAVLCYASSIVGKPLAKQKVAHWLCNGI